MIDTIQRITHTSRTAYRDSNHTYGGDTIPEDFRHFIMGLRQGNVSVPQIWSIMSSIVFIALIAQGFGIHFLNSFTTEIAQLIGVSFVNNCDMVHSDDDKEATQSKMQLTIL